MRVGLSCALFVTLVTAFPLSPLSSAPADQARDARAVVDELVACGTRHSLSSWSDPKRGIGCGRNAIVRRLEEIARSSGGKLRVVADTFEASSARTKNAVVPMTNVYGVVEGTDPALAKTAFAVSGHYDSMPSDIMDPAADAPGADDDASGVAVSILAAKALAATPARATLVFAAVAGEEQGLLGGKRLLDWLKLNGYSVGGMITCDIVGATNGSPDRRVRVFSEGGPDGIESPGRQLARAVEEINGKERVRLVFRLDRFGRGGDHRPFVEAGLAGIRFTEPLEDYRHQHQTPRTENGVEYGDLVKHMDFPFVADVAGVVAKTFVELGNAPAPPRSVTLGGAVTPSARPSIGADDDGERKGFEILSRETTDPRWSALRAVETAGETVLDNVSTDNHYFAVRSVGKNGKRSVAVPAVAAIRRPPGYVAADAPKPTPPAERLEKKE